jgi:uncharacterized membrane protein
MAGGESVARRGRRARSEHETEFARIVAFSDGVIAIAITLLTLNLDVPKVPSGDSAALADGLGDLVPHLFAYALSFAVVGRLWLVHHRFFATLQGFDGRLMIANLTYLALIVLVPFASDLLGTYGENEVAVMTYAAILGLAALVNVAMISYAMREDLVSAADRRSTAPFATARALITPGVFLVSIPVALVSPVAAQLIWLLAFVSVRFQRRAGSI